MAAEAHAYGCGHERASIRACADIACCPAPRRCSLRFRSRPLHRRYPSPGQVLCRICALGSRPWRVALNRDREGVATTRRPPRFHRRRSAECGSWIYPSRSAQRISIWATPSTRPDLVLPKAVSRYVGEPVALVVAESAAQASDAAAMIGVSIAPLPAVVDIERAIVPGAPVIWPDAPDNVAIRWQSGDPARRGCGLRHRGPCHAPETRQFADLRQSDRAANQHRPI